MLNARDAVWKDGHFGAYTRFEGEQARFPALGVNIGVLAPGQPACMYHGEDEQEDFLVLSGECLLLIEGRELRLRAWDFVHCPAWTEHVFVGAGEQPCAILAIGSRNAGDVVYPVSELALRHGAGVKHETHDPREVLRGRPGGRPDQLPRGLASGLGAPASGTSRASATPTSHHRRKRATMAPNPGAAHTS